MVSVLCLQMHGKRQEHLQPAMFLASLTTQSISLGLKLFPDLCTVHPGTLMLKNIKKVSDLDFTEIDRMILDPSVCITDR